jgi:hypothetical protein
MRGEEWSDTHLSEIKGELDRGIVEDVDDDALIEISRVVIERWEDEHKRPERHVDQGGRNEPEAASVRNDDDIIHVDQDDKEETENRAERTRSEDQEHQDQNSKREEEN